MESLYLIIVIILFILAISDLVVGVSNDAVNFLNSAIGSKVASFRVIMIIAAVGILFGTTFSSGMMEVARKSIFNPGMFYFSEIMIIFLAVMLTDILLLDFYNTFGLPTSTTVSIVFELLGAAVAVSVIKVASADMAGHTVSEFINSSRALLIISGILLSVVIAFTIGAIVQFITRIMFSFNLESTHKYFGALWGGMAISAITYFMVIKGAKGSSFLTEESIEWIKMNKWYILLFSFVGWTIILKLMMWLFNTNILKVIVLVGTFALAMAFASNDLVNFIGVPLAGFESFRDFISSGAMDPGEYTMEALAEKIKTPTSFLLIAGTVMVITLWFSKKARSVTKTTIDLSRQNEGEERFGSSMVARTIVRESIAFNRLLCKILPAKSMNWIESRFQNHPENGKEKEEGIAFDLLRASVNLVVAAILIAIGTSYKLPLSTTYVTFMVAMGTSLSDGAWNRESAVFRITGVFAVIGGWFLTAVTAFTISFLVALFIHWGNIYAIFTMVGIAFIIIVRTHALHKKRTYRLKEENDNVSITNSKVFEKCTYEIVEFNNQIKNIHQSLIEGLINEKRKQLKRIKSSLKEQLSQLQQLKHKAHKTIKKLQEDSIDTGHCYLQELDHLQHILNSLFEIWKVAYNHVDNNHNPLTTDQIEELKNIQESFTQYFNYISESISKNNFSEMKNIQKQTKKLIDVANKFSKANLKLVKNEKISIRNSLLLLELVNESKNIINYQSELIGSHLNFLNVTNGK